MTGFILKATRPRRGWPATLWGDLLGVALLQTPPVAHGATMLKKPVFVYLFAAFYSPLCDRVDRDGPLSLLGFGGRR